MKPSKSQAKERIQRALDEIPALKQMRYDAQEFAKWRRNTQIAVANTFGESTRHLKEFNRIRFTPMVLGETSLAWRADTYQKGLGRASALLESMLDEIEEYWSDDPGPAIPAPPTTTETPNSNQVFVVSGRDEGATDTVARFLETLELDPVILREQPNEGRTIIEKFEDYAQVRFAVVLCTPDDVGALAAERSQLKPRPR